MQANIVKVEVKIYMVKVGPLLINVRREFAYFNFHRSVQEIVMDNRVTLVARFRTSC